MKKTSSPEDESRLKANIFKGLAHPVRVAIVEMLQDKELCACDIAEKFPWDRTTISKHLALMRDLGILEGRRERQNNFYSLKMKCLISVLKCIEGVIETGQGCGCDYNLEL